MVLGATVTILTRQLLDIYSPFTFYAIRVIVGTPLMIALFGWHWHGLKSTRFLGEALSAVLSFIAVPLIYWSYQLFGVSTTAVVIGLGGPFVLYLAGEHFFHEKHNWRMAVGGLAILLLVGYVLGWVVPS